MFKNSNAKKVCLIINLYRPYNRGGAETVTEIIAHGLKKAGHKVFIIATKPRSTQHVTHNTKHTTHNTQHATRNTKSNPIKIYYINSSYHYLNKIPKFLRLFWHLIDMFDIINYFKIKAILKKEKPDVAITHTLKGIGFLTPLLIKRLKIKHIHTLHDIQLLHPSGLMFYNKEKLLNNLATKIYFNICKKLFNCVQTVISPSEWLMKIHVDNGFFKNSKRIILPNPVEIEADRHRMSGILDIRCLSASISSATATNFHFLYVGQIEEHKGILFLIKVFNALQKYHLNIVGPGSQLKTAAELAAGNKFITVLGKKSGVEILKLMHSSNCLIVPSLCYENSPTVIYEAVATGLPIIASRIGGIPELIHKFGGMLFEPGNENDLTRQIKYVVKNYQKIKKFSEENKKQIQEYKVNNYISLISNFLILKFKK